MTDEPPAKPMTAEEVVCRIAAECSYIDERGAVGIRLKSAAAIVRTYGEQCRQTALPHIQSPRRPARPKSAPQPALLLPTSDVRPKPREPGS